MQPPAGMGGPGSPTSGYQQAIATEFVARRGEPRSRCGCGCAGPNPGADVGDEPSPGADVGGVSPVSMQTWQANRRTQSATSSDRTGRRCHAERGKSVRADVRCYVHASTYLSIGRSIHAIIQAACASMRRCIARGWHRTAAVPSAAARASACVSLIEDARACPRRASSR